MTDQLHILGHTCDVRTVLADPPWDAEAGGGQCQRGANRHYPLMGVRDIVQTIQHECPLWPRLADTAHLWLWVTNATLANQDAHAVAQGLGFRPITLFTWAKVDDGNVQKGLGQYSFGSTEHLMLCRRGDYLPVRERFPTVFFAPREEHSAKPERSYEMIERASHPEFLELFARRRREGWLCWGNEVPEGAGHV